MKYLINLIRKMINSLTRIDTGPVEPTRPLPPPPPEIKMLDHTLIEDYCDTVAIYGIDSPQSQAVRDVNSGNTEFVSFADSIDRVKRAITGDKVEPTSQEIDDDSGS
jgi:hypothetical protein